MAGPGEIVEKFLAAYYGGDAAAARPYLADDFMFTGPAATFSSADAFLRTVLHVARSVQTVVTRKIFVDGSDVALFHDLVLADGAGATPVAAWFHLEGERIASLRMILDTGQFIAGQRTASADTAVDPVCGMTVAKTSAAAVRDHAGTTYYFCNAGCAAAFEQEPEHYLTHSH